jgi:hypothetical protein
MKLGSIWVDISVLKTGKGAVLIWDRLWNRPFMIRRLVCGVLLCLYVCFMKDGAVAHTATYSITALNKVCEDRLISHRLMPAGSACDFNLCGKLKDKVY